MRTPSEGLSFLLSALVFGSLVALLCAIASLIGIYFFAIVFLILVVLYRKPILGHARRLPGTRHADDADSPFI